MARSVLSETRETPEEDAPPPRFPPPPFQMRSVRRPARIALELFGPSTKRTASPMFDFPDPFGPVTAVYPGRKGTRTLWPNDLKFSISASFRCMGPHRARKGKLGLSGLGVPSLRLGLTLVRQPSDIGPGYLKVTAPLMGRTPSRRTRGPGRTSRAPGRASTAPRSRRPWPA